jgi:hypothetical protein
MQGAPPFVTLENFEPLYQKIRTLLQCQRAAAAHITGVDSFGR